MILPSNAVPFGSTIENQSHFAYYAAPMKKLPKAVRRWLQEIGAKGGKAKTPAKLEAVRANGKLGGRPKGSKTKKAKS